MVKETTKKKKTISMTLVNPNAAGIDIGDTIHAVAVPKGRDEEQVRIFGSMTCDLIEIASWLQKCKIDTIAMESTGIYWKPLFSILAKAGFEVYLVNARHVKSVSGRKSDEGDAIWIQKLHSCGLLKSSYLPEGEQEALRSLVRHRKTLIEDTQRFVLRMQKAMELMNIKIHTVIRDITGKTGSAIVEAIINGERNPENFLPLVDKNIRAERESIVKSLEGNWREDQLYLLKDCYESYQYFKKRIELCDIAIEEQLARYQKVINPDVEVDFNKKSSKRPTKNHPKFNVASYFSAILGTDVTSIFGISSICALEILSETGTDMTRWNSSRHFVSWLNLCPNNKISGGKLISSMLMKKLPNGASQAFRSAANAVQRSENWLGDYFRRMKSRGGNRYAIVATARKIATIYYKMVLNKTGFSPLDLKTYQEKHRIAKISYLEKKLNELKMGVPQLVI